MRKPTEANVCARARLFSGDWSGPAYWQVRGPLPKCVAGYPAEPPSEAAIEFIADALAATGQAEPVEFGVTYQAEAWGELGRWRRLVEERPDLAVDATMVAMIEDHCGEGRWGWIPIAERDRGGFVYFVDDEPVAFLAPRQVDAQDHRAWREAVRA